MIHSSGLLFLEFLFGVRNVILPVVFHVILVGSPVTFALTSFSHFFSKSRIIVKYPLPVPERRSIGWGSAVTPFDFGPSFGLSELGFMISSGVMIGASISFLATGFFPIKLRVGLYFCFSLRPHAPRGVVPGLGICWLTFESDYNLYLN